MASARLYQAEMPVHPDTNIMTIDGPRLARNIVGTPVVVSRERHISGTFEQMRDDRPMFEISTSRGYSIKCTAGHFLSICSGAKPIWREVSELSVGDHIALVGYRGEHVDRDCHDFEFGWLLGHIKGNGGHNPHNSSGTYLRFWSLDEQELINRAVRLLEMLGARRDFRPDLAHTNIVTVRSASLSQFVEEYMSASEKRAKRALIEAPLSTVAGYLQGFFDADGTVQSGTQKGRSIRLNQSNIDDLYVVQRMLLRLGMASTIYLRREAGEKNMPDGRGASKDYPVKRNWDLHISGSNVEQFYRMVSLSQPSKLQRLQEAVSGLVRRPNVENFLSKIVEIRHLGNGPSLYWQSFTDASYDADGILSKDVSPPLRSR